MPMEKKEDPMKFFARLDNIVVVQVSSRVDMPVEDVELRTVEVLTTD